MALRGTFLIDREGIVRHAVVNDLPLGRNVDEALGPILEGLRWLGIDWDDGPFYARLAKAPLPGVEATPEQIGKTLVAAAGVGVAAHLGALAIKRARQNKQVDDKVKEG